MANAAVSIFVATLAGAGVGAAVSRSRRTRLRGALVGGGLGLTAGLIANTLAGQFGAALGSGIGGAQVAAGLVPIIAAKKQGVAGCTTCSKRKPITTLEAPQTQAQTQTHSTNFKMTRDSCLECVEKHLGAALILITEVRDGYAEHRLRAIGHLHEAEDESQAWPELHNAIREARKAYQSQGTTPDFAVLAEIAKSVRMTASSPTNMNGAAA